MHVNHFNESAFQEALLLTDTWNFDLAVKKLVEIKQGEWSTERAELAVKNYKRYMAVTKALGGYQMVPNGDIDEIWHMHILDTRAYMEDTKKLFGEYLHHYPYFGMLGEENKQQWLNTQLESSDIWLTLFGENLYSGGNTPQKCPQVCPCHKDDNQTIDIDSIRMRKAS